MLPRWGARRVTPIVALAAALGAACSSGNPSLPSGASKSIDAKQLGESALETTIAAGTSKVAIDAAFGGATGIGFHSEGIFDYRVATGSLRFRGQDAASKEFEVRFIRGDAYVEVPTPYSRIPGVKPWARLDIRASAKAGYFGKLGSVTKQNPGEVLNFLRGAKSVSRIGPERIGSDDTTRYTMTVDLKEARKAAGNGSTLLSAIGESTLGDLVIDLWVDDKGRCRQVSYAVDPVTLQGGSTTSPDTLVMTVQYFDFGIPVSVSAPPSGDVGAPLST